MKTAKIKPPRFTHLRKRPVLSYYVADKLSRYADTEVGHYMRALMASTNRMQLHD